MKIVLRIEKAKMLTSLFTIFILKSICLFYRVNLRLVSLLINIWQGKSPVLWEYIVRMLGAGRRLLIVEDEPLMALLL
jgi:hypothetical protein